MIFGRNKSRVFLLIAAMLPLIAADPVSAIILHPDGEPNLATWTDRPPKDVVGRWNSGASCIGISPNCVITTRHQGGGTSSYVEIAGIRYNISQIWTHETADLRLARLHGANLPCFVSLYEETDESGQEIAIGGCGVGAGAELQTQGQTYGYEWGGLGSCALRLGTNRIENSVADSNLYGLVSDVIVADFDALDSGDSTAYECTGAVHDSGGGWFIKTGQSWSVAGLIRAVESHFEPGHDNDPNYILYESWFRDRDRPLVADADVLDAVRVSSYAKWINENLPGVLAGDFNGDDRVNSADFSVFAAQWERADCRAPDFCLGADFEPDGDVDALDLAYWAERWLVDVAAP